VWSAAVALAAMAVVFHMKRRHPRLERGRLDRLLRAGQAATVLPVCALTLATGGDDIPVLALSLLAFAYAARSKFFGTGLAIGAAGALKLFAWPVAVVLLVLAWHHGRRAALSYAVPALGVPAPALLPALPVHPPP